MTELERAQRDRVEDAQREREPGRGHRRAGRPGAGGEDDSEQCQGEQSRERDGANTASSPPPAAPAARARGERSNSAPP